MGANAALQCRQIAANTEMVLTIEWLTAMQALDFRQPQKSSPAIEQLKARYREAVPFLDKDRLLHDDMEKTVGWMRGRQFNALKSTCV